MRQKLISLTLVLLMALASGCGFVQTALADTPTPTPTPSYKITEENEAIAISSQYVPRDVAKSAYFVYAGIGTGGQIKTDTNHIYWGVFFYFDYPLLVTKDQLGWQPDNQTTLGLESYYDTIYIRIDAMTGELLYREAYSVSHFVETPGPILQEISSPSSLRPDFYWSPLAKSAEYEFILATDAALINVVVTDNVSEISYQLTFDLQPATTYFWAVKQTKPVEGVRTLGNFTTITPAGPGLRRISSPSSLRPSFSWSSVPGANEYKFILATDATLNNTVVNVVISDSLGVTSYQLTFDLQPDTKYYWAVNMTKPIEGIMAFSAFVTAPAVTVTMPLTSIPTQPTEAVFPPETTDTNWWLIGGSIAGGVIIVGLLVSLLIWRKRRKSNSAD